MTIQQLTLCGLVNQSSLLFIVSEFGENKAMSDETGVKKKALKELKFLDDKQAQNLSK